MSVKTLLIGGTDILVCLAPMYTSTQRLAQCLGADEYDNAWRSQQSTLFRIRLGKDLDQPISLIRRDPAVNAEVLGFVADIIRHLDPLHIPPRRKVRPILPQPDRLDMPHIAVFEMELIRLPRSKSLAADRPA